MTPETIIKLFLIVFAISAFLSVVAFLISRKDERDIEASEKIMEGVREMMKHAWDEQSIRTLYNHMILECLDVASIENYHYRRKNNISIRYSIHISFKEEYLEIRYILEGRNQILKQLNK